jgi:hypothetical protein
VNEQHESIWDRIQFCDPRVLYALFALILVLLHFFQVKTPVPIAPFTRALYERIERMGPSNFVLVGSHMDAGSLAETGGSFTSVTRHLMKRKIRFAVYTQAINPQGQLIATQLLTPLAKEMGAVYGKDYCIWQATPTDTGAPLSAMVKDFYGFVKKDINGTPLQDIPVMKGIRSVRDIDLYYSCSYYTDEVWIGFVGSVYGTPYAGGTASIMSSTAYPYLDAGQMVGLLPGAAGAAGYEYLLNAPGSGTRIVGIQSFAALYVFISIVIGNIAMVLSKRQKARADAAGGIS